MSINSKLQNFIIKARDIHKSSDGTPLYDYSNFIYVNNHTKGKIFCKRCLAYFEISPHNHISKHNHCGCSKCAGNKKYTTEEVITILNNIWKNKLDFSKTTYINSTTNLIYRCPKHGYQTATFKNLRRGSGCPLCDKENRFYSDNERENAKLNFIKEALKIHIDKNNNALYDYSEYKFNNVKSKGKIFCKRCKKYFEQSMDKHVNCKQGCPSCAHIESKPEKEIVQFLKNNYNYIILENNKKIIKSSLTDRYMELDIYLPEINLAIEFNGHYFHKQHENRFEKRYGYRGYHKMKAKLCKEKGIKLVNICDICWFKSKDKIFNKLKKVLANYK